MGNVINLADEKFQRTNAGKIVQACNILDAQVQQLVWVEKIPPNELLAALAQRLGVYISCTNADKDDIVKRLMKIVYRFAKK